MGHKILRKILRIGHRGARGHADENTLESFKKGLTLGCDFVEMDVQLTKDNVLIIFHDKKLDRTTNGKGLLRKKTLSEIKRLKTKSGFKIPTLEETLKVIKYKAWIEIKGYTPAKKASELIPKDNPISSFSKKALSQFPKHKRGWLVSPIRRILNPCLVRIAKKRDYSTLIVHQCIATKRLIEKCHQNKLSIVAYTVNNPERINTLKERGIDGIISDYPERIR